MSTKYELFLKKEFSYLSRFLEIEYCFLKMDMHDHSHDSKRLNQLSTKTKLKTKHIMKTINVTSKKTITLPNAFTMAELVAANPSVKPSTLYQRIQSMLREGDASPIKIVGDVKRDKKVGDEKVKTRGRAAVVYALVEASDGNNLIRQAKAQGVAKLKKQGIKQGVTVAKVESTEDVPTITDVAPLPDTTVSTEATV